jgi:hypothetical protein
MDSLFYLLSVLVGLGSIVAGVMLLWAVIEGAHFIYCKVTGREY